MSTTPIVPSTPAASTAPVATPAPQPTITPPTPAPAAPTTMASPAAGAPPAPAVSSPQPPAKPDPSEFGSTSDWFAANVTYQEQLEAFNAENPDATETNPAESGTLAPEVEAEAPPVETEKTSEEVPKVDEETYSLDEDPTVTPQALNDLIKNDEELKAALEANPAAKNQLFKMARENAELQQFKGIFPSGEAAKFAQKVSTETVALRHQFQVAETPEQMAGVFDSFAKQFQVFDGKGQPVIDPDTGGPLLGDDYYAYHEHVVDRYVGSTLEEVEARLAANQYASEDERERDNDLKLALSIVKGDLHPSAETAPDRSGLPEDARKQIEAAEARAKAAEEKLEGKNAGAKKQSREQVRSEGTKQFFKDAGTRTFEKVGKIIEQMEKAGAVINYWALNTTIPGSNVSAFNNEVGKSIEQAIKADSYTSNVMNDLELQYLRNPTPENMQARVAAYDSFLQARDASGRSLLNSIVTRLVRTHAKPVVDSAKSGHVDTAPNASREPVQGGAPKPQTMTRDDAWHAAEKALSKEVQGWDNMSQSERMAQIMTRSAQLLTAR